MRSAVKKRIKITKTGKVLRRAMGLGHFRAKKSGTQMGRKRLYRPLSTEVKNIIKTS